MLFHSDWHKLAMDIYTIYAFYLTYRFFVRMWNRFEAWHHHKQEEQWMKTSSLPSHSIE